MHLDSSTSPRLVDLELALNLSSDGVIIFKAVRNEHGLITDYQLMALNETAVGIFGMQHDDVVGKSFRVLWPGIEEDEYWPTFAAVVNKRETIHIEVERTTPAGDTLWFDVIFKPYGDGFASSHRNITETRQALQNANEQKIFYEDLLLQSVSRKCILSPVYDEARYLVDFRYEYANYGKGIDDAHRMLPEVDIDLTGKLLSEVAPSIRQTGVWDFCSEVLESGLANRTQLWYRVDGINTALDLAAKKLENGHVLVTITDANKSHQLALDLEAEKVRLQEGTELLNAVLNTSPIAIVVYRAVRNASGVIEDFEPMIANQQAIRLSGYSATDFLKLKYFERVPESREFRLAPLASVVNDQHSENFEHQAGPMGYWIHSITTPFRDGFIATAQDISAQKAQSRIIQEQAELFDGILRSLQNGLTIFGIIRNANGELEDLRYLEIADSVVRDSGFSREEIQGNSIRVLYPGIEFSEYWEAYKNVVNTGVSTHFETHYTLHGFDNYLLNWISPLGNDKLVSVYYIINDLKMAQRELEHKIVELRRSNDDLEQFASVASHDLQEPLRKVQSFGNMLEQRFSPQLNEEGKDLVRRMQNAASRMRNLVTGLLDFASLARGNNEQLASVDINFLIREVIWDLDESLKEVEGKIQLSSKFPPVLGISGQLRHLFHNLFTNAIKFRKPDVAPLVRVQLMPVSTADMNNLAPSMKKEQYLKIIVSDNGIGFEPAYAERIFSLFERLHGMSEYKGTGIGLSICRRVAERHNGAIWAESFPGQGSSFHILLQRVV